MQSGTTITGFLITALALLPPGGAAALQQPGEAEARETLARHGSAFSRHMVRVRVQRTVEIKRVDGVLISTEILPEGYTTGLVVTGEPLILVTAESMIRTPPRSSPLQIARPSGLSERQYMLLLKDGSTVETEIVGRIELLNMLELRPKNLEQVPDELKEPLSLKGARRPAAGDWLGLVAFSAPLRNSYVTTFALKLPADQAKDARPYLSLGLGYLNCPMLALDGSLAGILSSAPASPPPEGRPPAATQPTYLITGEELSIVLGNLISKTEPVVPYTPLGFRLQLRGDQLRVHSLTDLPEGETSAVLPGDVVLRLQGVPVKRLPEFDQVLEDSLDQGLRELTVELERNGEVLEVVLTL